MKNLLLTLTLLLPLTLNAQYNYQEPTINVCDIWEINPPINHWKHYESRQQFTAGLAFTGMTGLALHFNTIGNGPYIPFAVVYGTAAIGKFIHAGILRKQEKRYDQWGRRRLH